VVRVSVRFKDDISIVNLSGKFVAGGDGPFLRQKVKDLIEAGARKLLFEFEDVPYIDSTGLGFLAGSRELAAEAGATIVLSGMNPHVRRILDGVKLTQFFELVDDQNAGLAMLNQIRTETLSDGSKAPETVTGPTAESAKSARTRKRPAAAAE
jgi:anti-anti-sigma factor